jgi:hypothetical protein
MRTRISQILLVVCCLVAFSGSSAWASLDVFGVGTYSMGSGSPTPTSGFGIPGGGANLGIRLGSKVDFDLGALYATRLYTQGSSYTTTYLEASSGFRFMFSRGFYISVGGYYNYLLSNPQSLTGTDYGVNLGLGFRIPIGQSAAILIWPKYSLALGKMTAGANSVTPSEIKALVGFSFFLKSK